MRTTLAACCLFLSALAAFAQEAQSVSEDYRTGSFVESRSFLRKERDAFHEARVFAAKQFTKRWGWYATGDTSDFDSRGSAGVTYRPTAWLRVGIGGGFDQSRRPIRGSALVQVVKGRVDSTTLIDFGSGRARVTHATHYQLDEVTRIGVANEPSFGFGPRIELKPGKRVAIWGGAFRDTRAKRTRIGLGLKAYF